jgi:hypothetical protein
MENREAVFTVILEENFNTNIHPDEMITVTEAYIPV